MTVFASYVPTDSPAHRLSAGGKLFLLAGIGVAVFFIDTPWPLLAGLALVALLWGWAHLPLRLLIRQILLALPLALLVVAAQAWLADIMIGVLIALRYLLVVLLAAWVAGCTRVSDSIAALEWGLRPLGYLGIDPGKLALALSLTIRFLPLLADEARAIHEAQAARGRDRNWLALAVPLLVRALVLADAITDAIEARIGGGSNSSPT